MSCPWGIVLHKSQVTSFQVHKFISIYSRLKKKYEKKREIQGIQADVAEGNCRVMDWYGQKGRVGR